MSWSLKIKSGDLVVENTRLGIVEGPQKVVQDLRGAILERMGTDPLHPWFGSLIDGGVLNGQPQVSLIGTSDWDRAIAAIDADLRRIITQYQSQQIQRTEQDRMRYGRPSLTPNEIIDAIVDIQYHIAQDNVLALVTLRIGDENRRLTLTLGS